MEKAKKFNLKDVNIRNNTDKKYAIIFFISITILALLFRTVYINLQSGDYTNFLKLWLEFYRNNGHILAIGKGIGNYNIPYQILLAIASYLPISDLYLVKAISMFFDYIIAIFGYLIVKKLVAYQKQDDVYLPIITYFILLFLPTVTLNSSAWAQCDGIYTAFVLISIYCMIEDKSVLSFIFLGIAFGFKLQFIFIVPLYLLLCIKKKKFNIFEFLIIPAVNYIMCIPAFIYGKSFKDVTLIYFNQASEYKALTANMANIYTFISKNSDKIAYAGILFTFILVLFIVIFFSKKNIKLKEYDYIAIGLLMVMVENFFLPRMHERYLYMADVLSVIYYMINRKNIIVPIIVNFVSLHGYLYYLFNFRVIDSRIVALVYFIGIIYLFIAIYKDTYKNMYKKEVFKLESKNE